MPGSGWSGMRKWRQIKIFFSLSFLSLFFCKIDTDGWEITLSDRCEIHCSLLMMMIMVCLPYLHDDPAGVVAVDGDVKENSGVSHDRRAVGSRVLRMEGGAAPMQSGSESLFSIRVCLYDSTERWRQGVPRANHVRGSSISVPMNQSRYYRNGAQSKVWRRQLADDETRVRCRLHWAYI